MDGAGMTQVRRAIGRARASLGPDTAVLVALWNADPEKSNAEALARDLGVQKVVITLTGAAEAVRELLGPPLTSDPIAEPNAVPATESTTTPSLVAG